jgi:hypothetical protein
VRIAKPADRQEIWRLFLMGHRENGLFQLAPEKVDWFMTRVLEPELIPAWDTGPRGAIGVIGQLGALEGLVFVTIGTYWYSDVRHIEEYIVYVDPECRHSGHARALLDWMRNQVEVTRLPLVTGIMSTERTAAKCRLYREYFQPIGQFFYLAPKGQVAAIAGSTA